MAETTAGRSAAAAVIPARGKVTAVKEPLVFFAPSGTNYDLHLVAPPNYVATIGGLIDCVIRVTARKVWTVPSGGNFIAPIFGPPRTIQGRVRAIHDERLITVHAGAPILVELPEEDTGIDLVNGPIAVGAMVNLMAMPGARFEPVSK
jgi:hypothetical protein